MTNRPERTTGFQFQRVRRPIRVVDLINSAFAIGRRISVLIIKFTDRLKKIVCMYNLSSNFKKVQIENSTLNVSELTAFAASSFDSFLTSIPRPI